MATAAAMPEPIPDRSDVQKYIRFAVLDRVAHVGIMLDKMQRQIRRAEGYEMLAATGNPKYLEAAADEEGEMAVNIGNEYHYHQVAPIAATNGQTPTEAPQAETSSEEEETTDEEEEPPAQTSSSSQTSTTTTTTTNGSLTKYIAPTLIGAALVGSSVGGTLLYDYMTDKPDSVTTITQPGGRFEYRYDIQSRDRQD